jgi:peptide/nickel transport system substrate-binding protein
VAEYSPGAYAILKANPGYKTNNPLVTNQGPSKADTIRVIITDTEDFTAYTGITTGEYDILADTPTDYVEDLMTNPDVTVVTASGASVKYAEMNIKNEFLSDPNVRKAVILGISRDHINGYMNSFHEATYCLVQDLCLNYDPAAEEYYKANYAYDPELAKSLLAESGYTTAMETAMWIRMAKSLPSSSPSETTTPP